MKSRVMRLLAAVLASGAMVASGSGWAQLSVSASVSGSTLTVGATGSTSGLASGTYNASVYVTNSSGQTVLSGSSSFVVSSSGSMSLMTVDGRTYTAGMTVTNTSPQICGTYSNRSDVMAGYIAVMSGSSVSRFQQMAPPDSTGRFCANIVLDPGLNTVWAAYISAAGQLVYATSQMSLNNSTTNVSAGSVRIQLT